MESSSMAGEGPADYFGAQSEKTTSTNWNSITATRGLRHGRRTCKKRLGCRITNQANRNRKSPPHSAEDAVQRTENREQRTENRSQRSEIRGQRTELKTWNAQVRACLDLTDLLLELMLKI